MDTVNLSRSLLVQHKPYDIWKLSRTVDWVLLTVQHLGCSVLTNASHHDTSYTLPFHLRRVMREVRATRNAVWTNDTFWVAHYMMQCGRHFTDGLRASWTTGISQSWRLTVFTNAIPKNNLFVRVGDHSTKPPSCAIVTFAFNDSGHQSDIVEYWSFKLVRTITTFFSWVTKSQNDLKAKFL